MVAANTVASDFGAKYLLGDVLYYSISVVAMIFIAARNWIASDLLPYQ
jgi:hypothetical protein